MRFALPAFGLCLIALFALVVASTLSASPFRLEAYNIKHGPVLMILRPASKTACSGPFKGSGAVYRRYGHKRKLLYRLRGWFAGRSQVFLHSGGQYIVRIGWGGYFRLSEKHVGLYFYKRGRLIQTYSTRQLVRKPAAVQFRTALPKGCVHGYTFVKPGTARLRGHHFELTTVDGRRQRFDVRTGARLN